MFGRQPVNQGLNPFSSWAWTSIMSHVAFDERLYRINEKHRRLSVGVSYRIGEDGLIIPVPRRRFEPNFPARSLILLLLMAYAFKAALFVGLGEGLYVGRLALLEDGGQLGQAAIWLMQPDPVVRTAAALAAGADMAFLRIE